MAFGAFAFAYVVSVVVAFAAGAVACCLLGFPALVAVSVIVAVACFAAAGEQFSRIGKALWTARRVFPDSTGTYGVAGGNAGQSRGAQGAEGSRTLAPLSQPSLWSPNTTGNEAPAAPSSEYVTPVWDLYTAYVVAGRREASEGLAQQPWTDAARPSSQVPPFRAGLPSPCASPYTFSPGPSCLTASPFSTRGSPSSGEAVKQLPVEFGASYVREHTVSVERSWRRRSSAAEQPGQTLHSTPFVPSNRTPSMGAGTRTATRTGMLDGQMAPAPETSQSFVIHVATERRHTIQEHRLRGPEAAMDGPRPQSLATSAIDTRAQGSAAAERPEVPSTVPRSTGRTPNGRLSEGHQHRDRSERTAKLQCSHGYCPVCTPSRRRTEQSSREDAEQAKPQTDPAARSGESERAEGWATRRKEALPTVVASAQKENKPLTEPRDSSIESPARSIISPIPGAVPAVSLRSEVRADDTVAAREAFAERQVMGENTLEAPQGDAQQTASTSRSEPALPAVDIERPSQEPAQDARPEALDEQTAAQAIIAASLPLPLPPNPLDEVPVQAAQSSWPRPAVSGPVFTPPSLGQLGLEASLASLPLTALAVGAVLEEEMSPADGSAPPSYPMAEHSTSTPIASAWGMAPQAAWEAPAPPARPAQQLVSLFDSATCSSMTAPGGTAAKPAVPEALAGVVSTDAGTLVSQTPQVGASSATVEQLQAHASPSDPHQQRPQSEVVTAAPEAQQAGGAPSEPEEQGASAATKRGLEELESPAGSSPRAKLRRTDQEPASEASSTAVAAAAPAEVAQGVAPSPRPDLQEATGPRRVPARSRTPDNQPQTRRLRRSESPARVAAPAAAVPAASVQSTAVASPIAEGQEACGVAAKRVLERSQSPDAQPPSTRVRTSEPSPPVAAASVATNTVATDAAVPATAANTAATATAVPATEPAVAGGGAAESDSGQQLRWPRRPVGGEQYRGRLSGPV
eukprot:m51a1_g5120 hypothetical protein (972) ;mRNA; f:372395-376196